jgi:hypothetical protein
MPKNQTSGGRRYDGTLPFAPVRLKETGEIVPTLNTLVTAEKLDFSVESAAIESDLQYSTQGHSKDFLISEGKAHDNKNKRYAVKNLTLKITGSAIGEAETLLKETFGSQDIQRKKSPLASVSPLFGDYLEIRNVRILRSLAISGLNALAPYIDDLTPKEYTPTR